VISRPQFESVQIVSAFVQSIIAEKLIRWRQCDSGKSPSVVLSSWVICLSLLGFFVSSRVGYVQSLSLLLKAVSVHTPKEKHPDNRIFHSSQRIVLQPGFPTHITIVTLLSQIRSHPFLRPCDTHLATLHHVQRCEIGPRTIPASGLTFESGSTDLSYSTIAGDDCGLPSPMLLRFRNRPTHIGTPNPPDDYSYTRTL
jgi:hypothetical protein